jgi:hypothetical protein
VKRPAISTIADCKGGEVVVVPAGTMKLTGTLRLTHRLYGGERWAIPLRADLSEVPGQHIWLALNTRVLQVIDQPARAVDRDQSETDPLLKGLP